MSEIEVRQLRDPIVPNDNDPATVPPATVGPPAYTPGDPHGIEITSTAPPTASPPSPPVVMPWSGWPADWQTPNWWGRLDDLTDTAWGCLDLNSSILAAMPPYLVGASPSLPTGWLTNPDPDLYASWVEFAHNLFWDFQAVGEVFVITTARYSNDYPARFHVAPPWTVNVELDGHGRRRYSIGGVDVTDDVLHIRYQSSVGDAHGHGPLEAGRSRMVAASVLTRYGTNLASTGAIPNAVLSHPDELTADQAAALQAQWVNSRLASLGVPAVLSGGVTFEALQLSPADMALLDLLQFNESRIAVLLGVPPFLMGLPSGGDSLTYSNVVSLFDYHWRAGLRPKAARVMAALSGWALPAGTAIELNRDAYVQPGPYERAQTWEILIRIGVLTVEQVQDIERTIFVAPNQPISTGVL